MYVSVCDSIGCAWSHSEPCVSLRVCAGIGCALSHTDPYVCVCVFVCVFV